MLCLLNEINSYLVPIQVRIWVSARVRVWSYLNSRLGSCLFRVQIRILGLVYGSYLGSRLQNGVKFCKIFKI